MSVKFFLIIAGMWVAVLLQVSFLVHFLPNGMVPNLVFLIVFALSVFERVDSFSSVFPAGLSSSCFCSR